MAFITSNRGVCVTITPASGGVGRVVLTSGACLAAMLFDLSDSDDDGGDLRKRFGMYLDVRAVVIRIYGVVRAVVMGM